MSHEVQITIHPPATERCDICLSESGIACGHDSRSDYCDACGELANSQCVCERIAVVESSYPESVELGFRLAPVVVRITTDIECVVCERMRVNIEPPCSMCGSPEEPRVERHITVAVWPGHWANDCDVEIRSRLNELEPIWYNTVDTHRRPFDEIKEGYDQGYGDMERDDGWTIQGNRILSPAGRSTDLSVEQIIEIIREVTDDLGAKE